MSRVQSDVADLSQPPKPDFRTKLKNGFVKSVGVLIVVNVVALIEV